MYIGYNFYICQKYVKNLIENASHNAVGPLFGLEN